MIYINVIDIDIDREIWRNDMPGEIYQAIIQVDSEMTSSDSWYPYTDFKSDRYTDTYCPCHLVYLDSAI